MTDQRLPLRKVSFLIPVPDPIPFPHGMIQPFILDEQVPELSNVQLVPAIGLAPAPDEYAGRMFVSLKFWQLVVSHESEEELALVDKVVRSIVPAEFFEARAAGAEEARRVAYEDTDDPFLQRVREGVRELEGGGKPPGAYRTVVEAVTILRDEPPDPASAAYDRCVDKLAELVNALRRASGMPIAPITRERLPVVIHALTRDLVGDGGWSEFLHVAHLAWLDNFGSPGLTPEQRDSLNGHLATSWHPLVPLTVRAADANLALERYGDTAAAVINAQVSAEVLLDAVLKLLLWEEGISEEEAASTLSGGLAQRVKTQYAQRLGGNWSFDGKTPIARWNRDVVRLRGRVVHAAYEPRREEARQALGAVAELEEFVRKQIGSKRYTYPKTALVVLAQPGLERRGLWSKRFAELVHDHVNDPSPLFEEFAAWRAEVDAAQT